MQLDDLLEKLEHVRRSGNGYTALCPAHDDASASLGIAEGDEGLLLTCYAGCSTESVLDSLGLTWRDLFYNAVNHAEPEAIYDYVDEQGELLFQALRFPGKKFRQRHIDPETGEQVWNLDGVRRVLYRLPMVMQAVKQGQTVYLAEGEKDVEALYGAGKAATCNPMGAGKWKTEFTQYLSGAKVIIVADRDEPGRNHAEAVKQSLQGIASEVHVVQAARGKDAYDHLVEHGLPVEEFQPVRERRVRRGIVTAHELAEQAIEDLTLREGDVPGFVLVDSVPLVWRQGRMYAIGAYTGDGKTTFALQGARKLAEEGKRGGYFSLEMPERDLRNKLIAHRGIPMKMLEEPWRLASDSEAMALYHQAVAEIGEWNLDIIFESSINAEKVAEITRDREYDFIFVDHIHRFGWGSERRKLEEQVTTLTNLALEQNVMVVALCQLRRYSRGKDMIAYPRPTLQDFRETEMIGQDASMALAIWRARDDSGLTYTGGTEAFVLKNRHTTGPQDHAGRIFYPHFRQGTQTFADKPALEVVSA